MLANFILLVPDLVVISSGRTLLKSVNVSQLFKEYFITRLEHKLFRKLLVEYY